MEPTKIRFTESLLTRPPLSGSDVVTALGHFAIVTYAVDPARVRPHVHPRFDLETFLGADGPFWIADWIFRLTPGRV